MIEYYEVIEDNLKAEKCTSDFGGPNMWRLHIKTVNDKWGRVGLWESVQWMDVHKIQQFFDAKLPVYDEVDEVRRYELI